MTDRDCPHCGTPWDFAVEVDQECRYYHDTNVGHPCVAIAGSGYTYLGGGSGGAMVVLMVPENTLQYPTDRASTAP